MHKPYLKTNTVRTPLFVLENNIMNYCYELQLNMNCHLISVSQNGLEPLPVIF